MIEKQLKLGLLSTTVESQRNLYLNSEGGEGRKIFIVPVTINYHFVLEAPDLVNDYLQVKGQDRYFQEEDNYGSFPLLKFMFKFFTKGSNISVSIGRALDVIGNYVDEEGQSLDTNDNVIQTRDYFITNGKVSIDPQREGEYTRMLAAKIVGEYHRINRVFASHLVAFVAFEIFMKQHPVLDLFGVLRLPEEDLEIPYEEFRAAFKRVRKSIYLMKDENKINHATHMKGKADMVIKRGLDNVGIFHLRRPLLQNKKGNIVTQDLNLLYYYHNRLVGYGLEKHI